MLFIDTNVLLDYLIRRKPFYGHAAWPFDRIEREGHEAFVSAISFNNVYYLAKKLIGAANARQLVQDLRQLCKTVPLDDEVIDNAIKITIADFEDAIQAVSAGMIHTPFIITRNARDFENSGVEAYAPEEILALMDDLTPEFP